MGYLEERLKRKQGLAEPLSFKKDKKPIPKMSKKKKESIEKEKKERNGEDTELVKWYKRQMKFMDYCEETGLKIENKIYKYAIMSICHLLPKSKCPSVATHPCNRVFLIPDLHHKFDNKMSWEEKSKMACWDKIRDRLIMVYPDLHESERKYFPEIVLKYMEEHEPF